MVINLVIIKSFKKLIMEIGTKCYPIDNSYCFNITTNEDSNIKLAGTNCEPPKLVEIVSKPYNFEYINVIGEKGTNEFVNVKFSNNIYRVLNNFQFDYQECDHDGSELLNY